MSALQEVLSVLLGAEAEAKRIVEDANTESSSVIKTTQDVFIPDREVRMSSAREQAKSVVANALESAETEAKLIANLGREERDRVAKRFEKNVDAVVSALLSETVDKILAGGE
jgi:F-type H+-transporting ATPase subunit b